MLKKRKIDSNGLLMCKIQAQAFERSIDKMDCSSDVFIRRFMHSKIADLFDNEGILDIGLATSIDTIHILMRCLQPKFIEL